MATFEIVTSILEEITDILFRCKIYEQTYSIVSSTRTCTSAQKLLQGLPDLCETCFIFAAEAHIESEKRSIGKWYQQPSKSSIDPGDEDRMMASR